MTSDFIVRLTHWVTALLFFSNYFLTEGGGDLHQWLGYGVLVSVLARILWGVIGSPQARLSSFLPLVFRLKQYLSSWPNIQLDGHNPLGALMSLFLWTGLIICVISGHLQETDMFWGEDWPEILHEVTSDVILGAVVIHVMAMAVKHLYIKRK